MLDLDTTRPGHKTAARFLVDLDVSSNERQSAVAELAFNHPKINKVGRIITFIPESLFIEDQKMKMIQFVMKNILLELLNPSLLFTKSFTMDY